MIDILFAVFALYGFWVGYSRGIISTVLNLVSWFVAILGAMKLGPAAGDYVGALMPGSSSGVQFLAGILLTFIAILFLFRLLSRGLTQFLETVNINFINQVLGGVLSGFFFCLIYSGLLLFATNSNLIDEQAQEESITYPFAAALPDIAKDYGLLIWPVIQDFWAEASNMFDNVSDTMERDEADEIFDVDE
ncbi:MAG: CvpA family protein [Bacteroidota bacterium]